MTAIAGDRYRASGEPLAILGISIVLGFLNYLLWYGLLAAYQERRKLLIIAVGLGVNVGLNVLLIPPYGPTGAAIALVLSDLLIVAWQVVLIHRGIFGFPLRELLPKPLAAAALGALCGLAVAAWSDVAAGLFTAGVYVIALQSARVRFAQRMGAAHRSDSAVRATALCDGRCRMMSVVARKRSARALATGVFAAIRLLP